MRPDTVFLDLDGTLLDESGRAAAVARTCRELASQHPFLDADRLLAANSGAWAAVWDERGRDWMVGDIDDGWLGREAWRRTLGEVGVDDSSLVAEAQRVYEDFEGDSQVLFPDVASTLTALENAGLRLGLITNGAADTQRSKIGRLGLEARFDAIVISGEVGVMKPDPAIFVHALEAMGAGADRAWHVGDSHASDVAGANAAGIGSVWLNRDDRDGGGEIPRHTIRSLHELMPLLMIRFS